MIRKQNILWAYYLLSAAMPYPHSLRKLQSRKLGHEPSGKFLFIVGSGRSGNTLFRRLLMERYDIFIPPETYVLPRMVLDSLRTHKLGWASRVDMTLSFLEHHPEFTTFACDSLRPYALDAKNWSAQHRNLEELLIGLYRFLATASNMDSAWVGDKTPLNTLWLGVIGQAFPKARYIYLLRDGADVSVSYVKSGSYRELCDAGLRWVDSHNCWEAFKRNLPQSRYLEVRYEDLVKDPDGVLDAAVHLGIPSRNAKISVHHKLGDVSCREHHAKVSAAVDTSSIGKGRASLTPDERANLSKVLNTHLLRLGYPLL